jgi:hypothetical protein
LKEKGLFRISANAASLAKYQQVIDEGQTYDFTIDTGCDCHFVACLLKSYFRQLPDCLFTQEKFDAFLSCLGIIILDLILIPNFLGEEEDDVNMEKLKETISSIPSINNDLARSFFKILCEVAENEEFNCMGTSNLASMNAPNVLNSKVFDLQAMMKANQVVKVILENYSYFFTPQLEKQITPEDEIFENEMNSSVCYTEDFDDDSDISNVLDIDDHDTEDFESMFKYYFTKS